MRRAFALALAVAASAAPALAQRGARAAAGSPPAFVTRYLTALHERRYADAFAMLEATQRAYFRSATNFASGFTADGASLETFAIVGVRGADARHVVFARERIALDDPAHDVRVTTTVVVPYLVAGGDAAARIGESAGRPWRAFAADAAATSGALRVTVKKLAFDTHDIRVVVTLQNDGDRFVTVLPYGRSVLRDDDGGVFHPLPELAPAIADRQLFIGVRLAPNSRYTGALAFATPLLDDRDRRFTLTLGPAVRDGADAPFAVDVAGVAPRG